MSHTARPTRGSAYGASTSRQNDACRSLDWVRSLRAWMVGKQLYRTGRPYGAVAQVPYVFSKTIR